MSRIGLLAVVLLVSTSAQTSAVVPTAEELQKARAWAETRFEARTTVEPLPSSHISVVYNHDPVCVNSRAGKPLTIVDKQYHQGLYCHASSKVIVTLPPRAKSFRAVVGVDSNSQTMPGRGSVVFAVRADGKELFRSPVLREGVAGMPLDIDITGCRHLTLEVLDGGDGISCDQADWAEARVVQQDGKSLWLGDLPFAESSLPKDVPFCFHYGNASSRELLGRWKCESETKSLDQNRSQTTRTFTDPETSLEVRFEAIVYADYPVVEWTVYFANRGPTDTPLLSGIRSVDIELQRSDTDEFVLHHHRGDCCSPVSYCPQTTVLGTNAYRRFAPNGGRPTDGEWPYYNVQWAEGGVIVVVGWPGQWMAEFRRDKTTRLDVSAGQELTSLRLHPGEEIRTPSTVLLFYDGEYQRSQNLWRRWMMAHAVPRPYGNLPKPIVLAGTSGLYNEMVDATEANQKMSLDRYCEEGVAPDYWWMDAGWYPVKHQWYDTRGDWQVDTKRFPRGIRPVSDHAHARGIKTLLWFEPETVCGSTWLTENRPEWILGGSLVNLGIPEARRWLTERIDKVLADNAIDLYRQDFNQSPLSHWRNHDSEDRQGISEIRHVCGYLAMWDELRRRHPEMLIDSCASGGRRNDLETMRRSIPLLRSDHRLHSLGNQCMTHSLSQWLPAHGTCTAWRDTRFSTSQNKTANDLPIVPYAFWSDTTVFLAIGLDIRLRDLDYATASRLLRQWRSVADCYYGDYWPLTEHSLDDNVWIGWQFDLPEKGKGMVQIFRRPKSPMATQHFLLHGLDPKATYRFVQLAAEETAFDYPAQDLLSHGLPIEIVDQPGFAVFRYERIAPATEVAAGQ